MSDRETRALQRQAAAGDAEAAGALAGSACRRTGSHDFGTGLGCRRCSAERLPPEGRDGLPSLFWRVECPCMRSNRSPAAFAPFSGPGPMLSFPEPIELEPVHLSDPPGWGEPPLAWWKGYAGLCKRCDRVHVATYRWGVQ